MSKAKSALEYTTNVALIVVCFLLVLFFVKHRDLLLQGKSQTPGPVLTGTVLTPLSEYSWNEHNKTLVLALQIGCRFCEVSMPFYKRLVELRQSDRTHAYLLAIMPNDNAAAVRQLEASGVDVPCICGRPLSSIHVSQTPTLLLVNAQGRIEREWVGQLSPSGEEQVIAELQK